MPYITKQGTENIHHDEITPPNGWFTEEEIRNSPNTAYAENHDFIAYINATLPLATKKSEQVIEQLAAQLDMIVNVAYLTIDVDATYHVFLLVGLEDYHSTHMQAAKLLIEKYTGNSLDLAIRFTFTVDREQFRAYLSDNKFRLKHVSSIEREANG